MSNPEMRIEESMLIRMKDKINNILSITDEDEKKAILENLAGRIEELRNLLTERLRRDVPR